MVYIVKNWDGETVGALKNWSAKTQSTLSAFSSTPLEVVKHPDHWEIYSTFNNNLINKGV